MTKNEKGYILMYLRQINKNLCVCYKDTKRAATLLESLEKEIKDMPTEQVELTVDEEPDDWCEAIEARMDKLEQRLTFLEMANLKGEFKL